MIVCPKCCYRLWLQELLRLSNIKTKMIQLFIILNKSKSAATKL